MRSAARRRAMRRRPRRVARPRPRIGRARRQPVHYFKRMCRISDVTASYNSATGVSTAIAGTYALSLDSLPNYTEFTSLYDQYQIKGIKLTFVPSGNSYITSTISGVSTGNGFGRFHTVLDYDDSAVPASENELLQYQTLKTTAGYRSHSRYFKPKVQFSVADNDAIGTVASAAPRANVWLDCANPTIDHLGLKVWCSAPVNSAATTNTSCLITYSVYATLYLAFKNVR